MARVGEALAPPGVNYKPKASVKREQAAQPQCDIRPTPEAAADLAEVFPLPPI
jgi:hypothetical protein